MSMKPILLVLVLICMALVLQWLNDHYSKNNEVFRKLIHLLHGVGLAALVFIVSAEIIIAIELFLLVSMFGARYMFGHFNKLPWIRYMSRTYQVGRASYGEFFFPMSAIAAIMLANTRWEFAAAMLILGLADTAAALVGKAHGAKTSYKILGQRKSLVGSTAFYVVTLCVVLAFAWFAVPEVSASLIALLGVAWAITISENIGVYGTDNLLIPLATVYLLNAL